MAFRSWYRDRAARLGFCLAVAGALLPGIAIRAQSSIPTGAIPGAAVGVPRGWAADTVHINPRKPSLVRIGIATDSLGAVVPIRWHFPVAVSSATSMDRGVARFVRTGDPSVIVFVPRDPGATGYATVVLRDPRSPLGVGGVYSFVFEARRGRGKDIVFVAP